MAKERKTLNKIYEEQNSTGYIIGQRWFDSMTLKNVISEAYNDDSFEKEIGFARVDEWGVIALIGEDLIYDSNNAQIGQKFSIISNGNLYRVDYINSEIADTFEVKNSVVNIVDVDSFSKPSIKVGDIFKTFSLVNVIYRVKYRKSDLKTGTLDIRLYNGKLSTLGYYEHLKVYSADMLQVWDVSTSATKYSPSSTVNSFMQAVEKNLTSNITAEKVLYNSTTSVKEELDKKVNKSDTANILYGTDNTGAQTLLYQAMGNSGNTIAKRDGNGNLGVGLTPTQDYHATSKKYVDDKNEMCVKVEEDLPPAPNQIIVSAGDKRTVKSSNVNIDNIATKIEITAIYEKLEGKKNTYILDTSITLSILKQEIKFGRDVVIEDANGNNINQAIEEGRYDNIWLTNSSFNSNNNRILELPSSDQYLFVYKTQTDQTDSTINNTKRILFNLNDVLMEVGDIILITQTDVPDRWFGGRQYGFYTLETRKVDLSAGAISFDNSNIVKDFTFEWNGGVYVFVDDEYRPGYAHFNSGDSFIINPSYQNIYLGISREELLSHNSDFTYSGIVYYIPANQLESITGDTILIKRPRWGKNVQTILEQLAQEHTEFEELGAIVKNNMIVLKDTDNYEFSPSDRAQHSYLISCVSGWQNLVGVAHIVKQLVFSDKYVLDINFFGINVHNGGDKSPFYNIKTTINAGGPSSNPEYFTLTGLVSGNVVTSAILSKCTPENIIGSDLNVENGTGTNAVQMKQDGDSGVFDFTGKNPTATEIDETLTGEIPYGATGNFATVVGGKASAQGKRSMAQGTTTIAKGNYSHAEGDNSVAYGNDSHAEGFSTVSYGSASHSEGNNTVAGGEISHVEGFNNQTTPTAVGAHVEGAHNIARGEYSHVGGLHNEANMAGQFVVGHCNDNKETTVFEVGCGWTDENGNVVQRQNAFEVYLDGHAEVRAMGLTNKSVATKKYVDDKIKDVVVDVPDAASEITYNDNYTGLGINVQSAIDNLYTKVKNQKLNLTNGNAGTAGTNKNIQGGKESIADYDGDFVFGTGLRNTMEDQAVFGRWNDNTNWNYPRPLLMVGNGTSESNRNNAFEVLEDGHAEIQTMGSTDNSVATKAYVDAYHANFDNVTSIGSKNNLSIRAANSIVLESQNNDWHIIIGDDIIFTNQNKNVDFGLVSFITPITVPTSWVNGASLTVQDVLGFVLSHERIAYMYDGASTEEYPYNGICYLEPILIGNTKVVLRGTYSEINSHVSTNYLNYVNVTYEFVPDTSNSNNFKLTITKKNRVLKGTQLYKHTITGGGVMQDIPQQLFLITTQMSPFKNKEELANPGLEEFVNAFIYDTETEKSQVVIQKDRQNYSFVGDTLTFDANALAILIDIVEEL